MSIEDMAKNWEEGVTSPEANEKRIRNLKANIEKYQTKLCQRILGKDATAEDCPGLRSAAEKLVRKASRADWAGSVKYGKKAYMKGLTRWATQGFKGMERFEEEEEFEEELPRRRVARRVVY